MGDQGPSAFDVWQQTGIIPPAPATPKPPASAASAFGLIPALDVPAVPAFGMPPSAAPPAQSFTAPAPPPPAPSKPALSAFDQWQQTGVIPPASTAASPTLAPAPPAFDPPAAAPPIPAAPKQAADPYAFRPGETPDQYVKRQQIANQSDIGAAWDVGVKGAEQLGAGAVGLIGQGVENATGYQGLRKWGVGKYQQLEQEMQPYQEGRVSTLEQLGADPSLTNIGRYAAWSLGQIAPSVVESIGTALLGAAIGSTVPGAGTAVGAVTGLVEKTTGKALLKEAIGRIAAKEMAEKGVSAEVAHQVALKALAPRVGAATALFANSYTQGLGDIYGETLDPTGHGNMAAAIGGAIPYALADIIPDIAIAGRVLKGAEGQKALTRYVKAALVGGVQEGAGETAQEALLMLAGTASGKEYDAGTVVSRLGNSFAAAAIGGGVFGAAGGRKAPVSQADQDATTLGHLAHVGLAGQTDVGGVPADQVAATLAAPAAAPAVRQDAVARVTAAMQQRVPELADLWHQMGTQAVQAGVAIKVPTMQDQAAKAAAQALAAAKAAEAAALAKGEAPDAAKAKGEAVKVKVAGLGADAIAQDFAPTPPAIDPNAGPLERAATLVPPAGPPPVTPTGDLTPGPQPPTTPPVPPAPADPATTSTAEQIKAGMAALAQGAGYAGQLRTAELVAKHGETPLAKPESIAAAKSSPLYHVRDNPDGTASIIGAVHPDTGQWVGVAPPGAPNVAIPTAPNRPVEPAGAPGSAPADVLAQQPPVLQPGGLVAPGADQAGPPVEVPQPPGAPAPELRPADLAATPERAPVAAAPAAQPPADLAPTLTPAATSAPVAAPVTPIPETTTNGPEGSTQADQAIEGSAPDLPAAPGTGSGPPRAAGEATAQRAAGAGGPGLTPPTHEAADGAPLWATATPGLYLDADGIETEDRYATPVTTTPTGDQPNGQATNPPASTDATPGARGETQPPGQGEGSGQGSGSGLGPSTTPATGDQTNVEASPTPESLRPTEGQGRRKGQGQGQTAGARVAPTAATEGPTAAPIVREIAGQPRAYNNGRAAALDGKPSPKVARTAFARGYADVQAEQARRKTPVPAPAAPVGKEGLTTAGAKAPAPLAAPVSAEQPQPAQEPPKTRRLEISKADIGRRVAISGSGQHGTVTDFSPLERVYTVRADDGAFSYYGADKVSPLPEEPAAPAAEQPASPTKSPRYRAGHRAGLAGKPAPKNQSGPFAEGHKAGAAQRAVEQDAAPTAEELERLALLREFSGKWQYRTAGFQDALGPWHTSDTKDGAVEMAAKFYRQMPEVDRLGPEERASRANAEAFAQSDRQWKHLSLDQLRVMRDEMGASLPSLRKAAEREFTGVGGAGARRTGPAVAAQGARDTAETRMKLGIYIAEREAKETATAAPDATAPEPPAKPPKERPLEAGEFLPIEEDPRLQDKEIMQVARTWASTDGWHQQGGMRESANRDQQSRTTAWIPNDPSWLDRPAGVTEAVVKETFARLDRGQPLTKPQRAALRWYVNEADRYLTQQREWKAVDQWEQEEQPEADRGLAARLRVAGIQAMGEDAFEDLDERLSVQYADDDAGYLVALEQAINEAKSVVDTGQEGRGDDQVAPGGLTLSGQTDAEIRAAEAAAKAAADAEVAAAKKDEAKRKADAGIPDFNLSVVETNPQAQKAADLGQTGMDFGAPPVAPLEVATQPEAILDAILPPAPGETQDMDALFDSILDEEAGAILGTPQPTKARAPRAPRSPRSPATPRTVGAAAASAVKNVASGMDKAVEGLAALFGGNKLSSGLTFDEDTYAKAKPLFMAAASDFKNAAADIAEIMRTLIQKFLKSTGNKEAVAAMKPYILRFVEDVKAGTINLGESDVSTTAADATGDRAPGQGPADQGAVDAPGVGASDLAGSDGATTARTGQDGQRDSSLPSTGPAAVGKRRGPGISSADGRLGHRAGAAGPGYGERGHAGGPGGLPADAAGTKPVTAAARGSTKRVDRAAADSLPVKPNDLANIRATLPQLLPSQQDDVAFAEKRFADGGRGVLFTNGTGTGKTFTALGIIARSIRQGRGNIIITAPGDSVINSWAKAAREHFGITIHKLADIQDAGPVGSVVITTYANFYQNTALIDRQWDMVVHDEAHKLMENAAGEATGALDMSRALTGHPRGAYAYASMKEAALLAEIEPLKKQAEGVLRMASMGSSEKEFNTLNARLQKNLREWEAKQKAHVSNRAAVWEAKTTKRLDLSATPFAYEKSVDMAEGFLFDYGPTNTSGAYNTPDPRGDFMIQHFGWRMRTGKLTQPDAKVDSSIMQRAFNRWLKQQGALSGRALDVDFDYSREFVAVNDLIGNKIDEGMGYIQDRAYDQDDPMRAAYRDYLDKINDAFDYHARIRLLEAIKAPYAVERAKQHIAMGRKVVIFHSRIQGGSVHPFRFPHPVPAAPWGDAMSRMESERPDLFNIDLGALSRPLDLFQREFGSRVTFYNGTVNKKGKVANPVDFNIDTVLGGKYDVIVVQDEGGKEGISLHDTTGAHQRALLNIGLPVKPTQVIQIEGRTYRVGQQSDAIFEYFNTGTSFERWTFASKISERAGTAENLAMGDSARRLRDAFVDAFEDPTNGPPTTEQGKGGKETDRALESALTPFQEAKTHYFGQQKNTKSRGNREGIDYFATPEPLGVKMVEWAGMRPGEAALEPSAGHGAIARYFPGDVRGMFVEPSSDLMSRLALRASGTLRNQRFEELDEVNKFDTIVMNPPYGSGGKTAAEHVAKAMNHLKNGGRIVALVPEGGAALRRFDALLYGDRHDRSGFDEITILRHNLTEAKKVGKGSGPIQQRINQLTSFHVRAEISLPPVTFERAGTAVKTRILIIDRVDADSAKGREISQRSRRDIEADDINALFDGIENATVPERLTGLVSAEDVLVNHGMKVQVIEATDSLEGGFVLSGKTYENRSLIGPIMRKHDGVFDRNRKVWTAKRDPTEDLAKALQGEPVEGLMEEPPAPSGPPAAGLVEHVTANGKTLRGIVRTDLSQVQAKAIDPYTFKKDGGFFIREKHLAQMQAAEAPPEAPRFSLGNLPGGARFHLAYHGSPHDFEAFSIVNIGSGEGAQGQGWGLYFAESEDVAKYYRDSVSKRKGVTTEKLYHVDLAPQQDEYLDWDKPLSQQSESVRQGLIKLGLLKAPSVDAIIDRFDLAIAREKEKIDKLPEDMRSRSSGYLRELSDSRFRHIRLLIPEDATGKDAYLAVVRESRKAGASERDAPRRASESLAKYGIPGVRYLDAKSRQQGSGDYNYVIFDDKNVTITAKYAVGQARTRAASLPRLTQAFLDAKLQPLFAKLKGLSGAATLRVVQTEGELPAAAVAGLREARGSNPGATAKAVFIPGEKGAKGTIWAVADNLADVKDALVTVLVHEGAHAGLRAAFGPTLNPFLDELIADRQADVALYASARGLSMENLDERREAADEFLAHLAEVNAGRDQSFLERVYAAIRAALRRLGFVLHFSPADLREIVAGVASFNRTGDAKGALRLRGRFGQGSGERAGGARFMFAGRGAKTADQQALSTAQARLDAGEDADTVRQETGWFKGVESTPEFSGVGVWPKLVERFSVPDSAVNRVGAYFKLLSDLLVSETFKSQGFDGFDVPTKRLVMSVVLSAAHDPEIRNRVIERIPVNVMNDLVAQQLSPDVLFNDMTMLKNLLTVNSDTFIPVDIDAATSRVLSMDLSAFVAKAVASIATENSSALLRAGLRSKTIPAVATDQRGRFFIFPSAATGTKKPSAFASLDGSGRDVESNGALIALDGRHSVTDKNVFDSGILAQNIKDVSSRPPQRTIWKFEINDSGAMLRTKIDGAFRTYGDRTVATAPLASVLSHPSLFAAYPHLRTFPSHIVIDPQFKRPGGFFDFGKIEVKANTEEDALSMLLHEVQHMLQHLEQFPSGGSPEDVNEDVLYRQAQKDLAELDDKIAANNEEREKVDTPELMAALNAEAKSLRERHEQLRKDMSDPYRLQHRRYTRLAGEVEARNTQARQALTAEQRRATSPASTADVRPEDVIVVYNGREMASAPPPANATGARLATGRAGEPSGTTGAFTESAYRPAVVAWAKERFGEERAPDGGLAWQRFVEWFGGSRVVDSEGKPLTAYHGSESSFDEFDSGRLGNNTLANDASVGFHFSDNRADADLYATMAASKEGKDSGVVRPFYLSLKNPLIVGIDETDGNAGDRYQEFLDDKEEAKRFAENNGKDGIIYLYGTNVDSGYTAIAFTANQIKSADQNTGQFSPSPDIRFALGGAQAVPEYLAQHGQVGIDLARKLGVGQTGPTIRERFEALRAGWKDKAIQGIFDQFAPISKLGDNQHAYMLARQSGATDQAMEATMQHGLPFMHPDGGLDVRDDGKGGALAMFADLKGEHERALLWMAGNRAAGIVERAEAAQARAADLKAKIATLKVQRADEIGFAARGIGQQPNWIVLNAAELARREARPEDLGVDRLARVKAIDKEMAGLSSQYAAQVKRAAVTERNLTAEQITLAQTLNDGQMPDGRDRAATYEAFRARFQQINGAVLDVGEAAGDIDPESRKLWESEFYVNFSRDLGEGATFNPNIGGALVHGSPIHRMKGGVDATRNLLDNTLANWAALLSSAARTKAAAETLLAAEQMGVAQRIAPRIAARLGASAKKSLVAARIDGKEVTFQVPDVALINALHSLEAVGFKGPIMDGLRAFKRVLTVSVTSAPAFKFFRNPVRDAVSAMASSGLAYNPATNARQGWAALSDPNVAPHLLAGGGSFRMGSSWEGTRADHTRRLLEEMNKDTNTLSTPTKVADFLKRTWERYQEAGDKIENIQRAALYVQELAVGKSHLAASFAARDLMDFSLSGAAPAVRFLTTMVPFMNARLQGLYKLGRAGHADPKRMAMVLGATTLAGLALALAYRDDEDWKRREDWDRESYFWFKIGDVAFRIPRPFEIGAVGSVVENAVGLFTDDEMTGKRFRDRLMSVIGNQLAMNPIPQILKPAIDVYANKNSFTGAPIESMGMERLLPQDRFTARTTETARGLSTALNAGAGLLGAQSLSPVQIDSLVSGYLGWAGTMTLFAADQMAKPLLGRPASPSLPVRWWGGVAEDLKGDPVRSRYVTTFYEQGRQLQEAYASWQTVGKVGDTARQAAILRKFGQTLPADARRAARLQRGLTALSTKRKEIERGPDTPTQKSRQLFDISMQADALAQQIGPLR